MKVALFCTTLLAASFSFAHAAPSIAPQEVPSPERLAGWDTNNARTKDFQVAKDRYFPLV